MATKRRGFTDEQKARIFSRDRATCCFSGANLWLLDAPLRPGYQRDWVDHIRPLARGGMSIETNGVCASHAFNSKKRHNTADSNYLFRDGIPTLYQFAIFGTLSPSQEQRLDRLKTLQAADWHFNRAIGLALLGFDYRIGQSGCDEIPKRDDSYWFRAAFKQITAFQKAEGTSLEDRGIIIEPSTVQKQWLALRTASSLISLVEAISPLFRTYKSNARAWNRYFKDAKTPAQRTAALNSARKNDELTCDVLSCLESDNTCRTSV